MPVIDYEENLEVDCMPSSFLHERLRSLQEEKYLLETERDVLTELMREVADAEGELEVADALTKVREFAGEFPKPLPF